MRILFIIALPALLCPAHQVVEEELKRVPPSIARHNSSQLWSIIYVPQVGYLMQVTGQPFTGVVAGCVLHGGWHEQVLRSASHIQAGT